MENPYIDEQMEKALRLLKEERPVEALTIYEMIDLRSATEIQRAVICNDTGVAYKRMGLYKEAEKKYAEALAIYEKNEAKQYEGYIYTLNNIAMLLEVKGEYLEAERLYTEILSLSRTIFGEDSEMYALRLNNLGIHYFKMGLYRKAETCLLKAKHIKEQATGKRTIKYIQAVNNLAVLSNQKGDFQKASDYYAETVTLMEEIGFTENSHYIKALGNQCRVLMETGDYNGAEDSLKKIEASNILHEVKYTEDYSNLLLAHARLERKLNHALAALKFLNKAMDIAELHDQRNTLLFTELLAEKATLLTENGKKEASFQRLLEAVQIQNAIFTNTAFNFEESEALLFLRRINGEYNALLQLLLSDFYTDREKVRETYVNILLRKSIILEMTMIQNIILRREDEGNEEKALTLEVFKEQYLAKLLHIDYEGLIERLPRGSVFLDFYYLDETERYVLFILSADSEIEVYDVGSATELNALIEEYRNSITETSKRGRHQSLSAKLLPLLLPFTDVPWPEKIVVSPVNDISKLPFETLMDAEGYFLIEKSFIKYIASVKDVIGDAPSGSGNTVSIVSDPDFDYPFEAERCERLYRGNSGMKTERYQRLSGIKREGTIVEGLFRAHGWKVEYAFKGKTASGPNIRKIGKSSVLHIVSHGFFHDNDNYHTNPLKDCGLVFTGINSLLNYPELLDEGEKKVIGSGILTAYDLTFMNLTHTELLVLSACRTGLGQIETGNGVLGFQRAVLLAGVRKLLMTLWDVSDHYSSELMEAFYSEYIAHRDAEAALRTAKLKLIDKSYKELGHADPCLWGGYVCLSRSF